MTTQDTSTSTVVHPTSLIIQGQTEALRGIVRAAQDQALKPDTGVQTTTLLIPDSLGNDPMTAYAFQYIKDAMHADDGYAWSWHCNLAMAFVDGGKITHEQANRGAALFMQHCFNVDVTKFKVWKDLEPQWTPVAA